MPRPLLTATGALLAGGGLLVGIASLAVPWGRYRVHGSALNAQAIADPAPIAVFQVPGGTWYLLAVGLLAGLLAIAALDTGKATDVALTLAPTLGLLTIFVVVTVANGLGRSTGGVMAPGFAQFQVAGETAEGVWLGLAAGPLLGFGAGLVALGRRRAR
jgi:hypothetical protein